MDPTSPEFDAAGDSRQRLELRKLLREAIGGKAQAQSALGDALRDGKGFVPDRDYAIFWYEKAAAQNYAPALRNLAMARLEENIANLQLALDLLLRASDAGDAPAALYLANWHEKTKDAHLACRFYEIAARGGLAAAWSGLGAHYLHGTGVLRDARKALECFENAGDDPVALFYRAECALAGAGCEKDEKKARKFMRLAADAGFAPAQNRMGDYCEGAIGAPANLTLAVEYFRLAAEGGLCEAMLQLGLHLLEGVGAPQDESSAIEWLTKAARENSEAMFMLGCMNELGRGMPKNSLRAVEMYAQAAACGHIGAMRALGMHYLRGDGAPQDAARGAALLQEAAQGGDAAAMKNLARCHELGLGVTRDERKAFTWMEKAADQGRAEAWVLFGDYHMAGMGTPVNAEKAARWYALAASAENPAGLCRLGWCCLRGKGVPQDEQRGLRLLARAQALGDPDADEIMARLTVKPAKKNTH